MPHVSSNIYGPNCSEVLTLRRQIGRIYERLMLFAYIQLFLARLAVPLSSISTEPFLRPTFHFSYRLLLLYLSSYFKEKREAGHYPTGLPK